MWLTTDLSQFPLYIDASLRKLIISNLLPKEVQEPRALVVRQRTASLRRPGPLVIAERAILTVDESLAIDLVGVFYLLFITCFTILFLKKCISHVGGNALVEPKVRPIRAGYRNTPPLMRQLVYKEPGVIADGPKRPQNNAPARV